MAVSGLLTREPVTRDPCPSLGPPLPHHETQSDGVGWAVPFPPAAFHHTGFGATFVSKPIKKIC